MIRVRSDFSGVGAFNQALRTTDDNANTFNDWFNYLGGKFNRSECSLQNLKKSKFMKQTIFQLIKEHKLDGRMQTREKVYKRYYLMSVLYSLNTMPLREIGEAFKRDHATVIHGVKQHNKWWHTHDELYFRMIHDLVEMIQPELLSLPKNYYFKCQAGQNIVTIQGNFTQKMLNSLNQTLNRNEISAIFAE